MPPYLISTTTKRRSLRVGVAGVATSVLLSFAPLVMTADITNSDLKIDLRTSRVGDGVVTGTAVQVNGVDIGTVASVQSRGDGTQLITLRLPGAEGAGLTDDFTVDYAPQNLFGITALNLRPGAGGGALREGQLVDLTRGTSVTDSTMGTLLASMGEVASEVLTPKLSELLRKSSTSLEAFTPLMTAMLTLAREAADARKYPTHVLLERYADVLDGSGDLSVSTMVLFKSVYSTPILRGERPLFDTAIALLSESALPRLAAMSAVSEEPQAPSMNQMAPVLASLAKTVREPAVSRVQLAELLRRIDRVFGDSPSGPTLDVALTVLLPGITGGRTMPGPTRGGGQR